MINKADALKIASDLIRRLERAMVELRKKGLTHSAAPFGHIVREDAEKRKGE